MYDCKIAEKLAELRKAKGVTQEEVAQSLSVSIKTVSKWENGVSTPDLFMLMALSKYYGVSTDTLLGLSEKKTQSTKEEIRSLFEGLDRRESVLKAFETAKALVPAMLGRMAQRTDDRDGKEGPFPPKPMNGYRFRIAQDDFFEFLASSENVNVAVMLLQNRENFAWMNDASKQKEIVKIFKFLSNEDTLSVLNFIHSKSCSESFTAEYISKNTGIKEERSAEILDEFCSVGSCHWVTAHLAEGEMKVYECRGDGIVLSMLSLAFERMCGSRSYAYSLSGSCKMIGGR